MKEAIYVPGGPGAVPTKSVEGVFGRRRAVRLAGWDDFDTSNQTATWMVRQGKLPEETVRAANAARI